jgi:SAM-dependent methyltransferase
MVTTAGTQYSVDNKEFWERIYQTGNVPWDLKAPSPPLVTFTKSPYMVKPGAIGVLGCGNGYDCLPFAENGFQVTGIDFAPSAIQHTYKLFLEKGVAGTTGFLLERDVFEMHEYDHYFDYILEHNFFSSIGLDRRRTYAHRIHDLLKPGGKLISLWWTNDRAGGPPFGISKDALYLLFGEFFTFDIVFEPTNSAPGRQKQELFTLMTSR